MATRPGRRDATAATRSRLVDAALEIFARRGYDGASIDAIAAQAGLTSGALYGHFASKDDLFIAAAERGLETMLDGYRAAFELETGLDQRLRHGAGAWMAAVGR